MFPIYKLRSFNGISIALKWLWILWISLIKVVNDEEVRDVKEKEDKLQTLPSDIYNLMNGVEDVIENFW